MAIALTLARRGLGNVWPNPAVGCVVVADGRVVGRGWTLPSGRPHAETEALRRAGAAARGATAYVSLEPCAHHGATPPCAEALVAAGIARAVIALADPDPRVDGRGLARLAEAGVAVEAGVLEDEARALNEGFLRRVREGRPMVTLKLAASLDGRIATRTGESRWITGAEAREIAHGLRARHDAILVGAGTARRDDPRLDCRLPGLAARSPLRVVVDGRAPLPPTLDLVAAAGERPTWILAPDSRVEERRSRYADSAVEILAAGREGADGVDLRAGLEALARHGITRVLVEGGGRVAAALLAAGLVDHLVWFRAGRVIGGDGVAAVEACGVAALDDAPKFVKLSVRSAGADIVEHWARAE